MIPEDLNPLLDSEDAQAAWLKMSEKQQLFFLAWFRSGYNGTQAYLAAYAKKDDDGRWDMTDQVASSAAHRLLRNPKIVIIRNVMYKALQEEVPNDVLDYVEFKALESDDPTIRLRAAKQIRERHFLMNPPGGGFPISNQYNFFGADLGGLVDIINGGKRYKADGNIQLQPPGERKDSGVQFRRSRKQNGAKRGKNSRKSGKS